MLIAGTGTLAQDFADRVEASPASGCRSSAICRCRANRIGGVAAGARVAGGDRGGLPLHGSSTRWRLPAADGRQPLEPITRLAADEGKTVRIPVDPVEAGDPRLPGGVRWLPRAIPGPRRPTRSGPRRQAVDGHRRRGGRAGRPEPDPPRNGPGPSGCARARRSSSGRPASGLHGRPFTIYKFRTMVPDAEDRLARSPTSTSSRARLQGDQRPARHPVGRLLRASSLDELPQLWNVLKGEMSLVGPRPPLSLRGRGVRHLAPPPAEHEAGDHRPVAGRGAPRAGVRPLGRARPATSIAGRSGSTSRSCLRTIPAVLVRTGR